jgi:hypothetical protein
MQCVIIKFKGAGLFDNLKYSKDKACDTEGMHERRNFRHIDVPVGTLSVRHISNLLHVLCGERPSPSLRKSFIKPLTRITGLAQKACVRVTSVVNRDKYLPEAKTIRKAIENSWQTATHDIFLNGKRQPLKGLIYWERLRAYLGNELSDKFKALAEKLLGRECLSLSLEAIIERLNAEHKEGIKPFLCELTANRRTAFAQLLSGDTATAAFNQVTNDLVRITVPKGKENICRIDGEIFLPVEPAEMELLRKGTGVATFLEGGYAYIASVEDDYNDNLVFDTVKPVE